jgi:hypothetical protein
MEGGTSLAFCPCVGGHRGGTMPPDGDSLNEGHIDVVLLLARTCGWHIRSLAAKKTRHYPAARAQPAVVESYPARSPAPMGPLYAACRGMTIAFPHVRSPQGENTMQKLLLIAALCSISATALADEAVKWHHVQHVAAIQSQDVAVFPITVQVRLW